MGLSLAKERTYVLFSTNTQGMAMHRALDEVDIFNRITSTPRTEDLVMPCGMCLLVQAEDVEQIKAIAEQKALDYLDVVTI